MKMRTIFRRAAVTSSLVAVAQLSPFQAAAIALQKEEGVTKTTMLVAVTSKSSETTNELNTLKRGNPLARPMDRIPVVNLKKMETDKITSFFVRANDSRRIQLSMLVVYKKELAVAIQKMYGQKVTPLVFSVSTFPNRNVAFDPAKLRFEQRGRIWHPENNPDIVDILPLDDNAKFGGMVTDGEVHQGIVLLPAWMNPQEPITLRYGDFHYLARFAEAQANNK